MNIAHTLQMYNYQFSSQTPWLPSMRRRKRSGVYILLIHQEYYWSQVVWWLGFCGLTATTGVRFPVWEVFLLCCYSFFSTTLHEQLHSLVLVVFLHLIRRQCVCCAKVTATSLGKLNLSSAWFETWFHPISTYLVWITACVQYIFCFAVHLLLETTE